MIRQMILLALAAADYFRAAQFRGRRRLRRTSVAERYGPISVGCSVAVAWYSTSEATTSVERMQPTSKPVCADEGRPLISAVLERTVWTKPQ